MELIIQILMLFIVINCVIKLSFWKLWQALIFGLLCGAFIIATCQYAILQSKTNLADYLTNISVMQDAAVLITAESCICFGFCFIAIQRLFGRKTARWTKILNWYAGLLIFPVLFYILTQLIFNLSGINFTTTAWVLAAITTLVLPLLSYAVKYLLPENDLRLEVHFLVSLFVCILGLITTVNGNVTYNAIDEPVNIKAILLSVGLFATTFLIGFIWNKFKWIRLQQKSLKEKNKHQQSNL